MQARERGIPIICIEPRYTPSVEVLADQWIPIRPTTDVAMMIAQNLHFDVLGTLDVAFDEDVALAKGRPGFALRFGQLVL